MRVMIEIMHAVRIFSSILSSSGAEEIVENMFTAVMVRYLIRLPREERSEGAIKSNNGYYQLAPSYPVGRSSRPIAEVQTSYYPPGNKPPAQYSRIGGCVTNLAPCSGAARGARICL